MDLTSDHPFWTVKNGILSNYPPLTSDHSCDIAIIGAGITGALVAEALTADGHDVMIIDSRDVGRGSTSASTALLQYEVDTHLIDLIERHGKNEAELAYRACHESIDLLEQRIRALGIACGFQRKDSVYLASAESDIDTLKREYKARRSIGIRLSEWSPTDVASRFGFYRPGALHSTQAAEVDPYQLTHGLLSAAAKRGARIYDKTRITSIERKGSGLSLETNRSAKIRAGRVVVASGYETSEIFDTGKFVNLNSSFAIATEPLSEDDFWWNKCLLWETARPYFYLRTSADGRAIIGGEDVPFRNAEARDKLIPAKAGKLQSAFSAMFPAIPSETAFCWAGTFGETEDGLAYIGQYDKYPLCHFALGFGGNGITYSMIAAEIIRADIRGLRHGYTKVFRFDR